MSQMQDIRILQKVDLKANWEEKNPCLLNKEIGYERETGKYKIGDGNTHWNNLPYASSENTENLVGKKTDIIAAEIFNDYENNKAELPYSHVEGRDNLASFKVFLPQSISVAGNSVTLDSIADIAVGMKTTLLQIRTTMGNPGISTRENNFIKSIVGNTIVFENPMTKYMTDAVYPFTNNVDSDLVFIVGDGTIGSQVCANRFMASHAEGMFTQAGVVGHSEGFLTLAIGVGAHAEGKKTQALQEGAHAEGYMSIANGHYAHAEGTKTEATANYTHAEGFQTKATAEHAHAEGYQTVASKGAAHAEGHIASATGDYSHAEGNNTKASGTASHAEGRMTEASGEASHTEGNHTEASGVTAHAEGTNTKATANYTHAEGYYAEASGVAAHAEGNITYAIGDYSHSEGSVTRASGSVSHAEGGNTQAIGQYSHAEGYDNIASKEAAHVEGRQNAATGLASHAEGYIVKAVGDYSHAENHKTQAIGMFSHAEGYETIANGYYSHSQGLRTIASGASQCVDGKYNVEDTEDKYAHITGNGTSDKKRSNACTLDWEGNAWFAGGITVGSDNKEVALKEEVYSKVEVDAKIDAIDITTENNNSDILTIQNLQKYYGDVSITPSPTEWFNFNENSLIHNIGEPLSGEVVVPYEYDGYLVTGMEEGTIRGAGITKLILPGSLNFVSGFGSADPQEVILCEGIKTIERFTFQNCLSLTKITIPKSVNWIQNSAFFGCINLTDVYYEGSEKDWKKIQIADGNDLLLNADIHYQYTEEFGNIAIDTEMSDNSENVVQNKVIKAYIDDITGDIETVIDNIIDIQNALIGGENV